MNFSGKNIELKADFVSKYLNPGIQEIRINSMEVQTASTGSVRMQFNCEGRPVQNPSFEGVDGAKGPVGRIRSNYAKGEESQLEFIAAMKDLANKIGRVDEFNTIEAPTFEDYMNKLAASNVLCGVYFRTIVTGEEYISSGKVRSSLGFARYRFVENTAVNLDDSKLVWNPKYHLKTIDATGIATLEAAKADHSSLPF